VSQGSVMGACPALFPWDPHPGWRADQRGRRSVKGTSRRLCGQVAGIRFVRERFGNLPLVENGGCERLGHSITAVETHTSSQCSAARGGQADFQLRPEVDLLPDGQPLRRFHRRLADLCITAQ
jgi:hypothetical protein